jgi:hypothetical protein
LYDKERGTQKKKTIPARLEPIAVVVQVAGGGDGHCHHSSSLRAMLPTVVVTIEKN